MSLPTILRPAARREFDEASNWYENRKSGLGFAFVKAVRDILLSISANPVAHAVVHSDVREALVPGYPYAVYYREEPTYFSVLAIFHTSRDPTIWQSRASS